MLECPRGGNRTLSNSGDGFPQQTAWTAILEARDPASPERRARLERLAALYWSPVFQHLRLQWKLSPEDAADLSQEFFLRFIDEDFLRHASPERGRFRTFLRLKLRDLVVDDLRRSSALKRGGGAKIVPLDSSAAQEPRWKGLQPDEAFDREWAACLMTESIRALESQLRAAGQGAAFEAFSHCVLQKPPKSYRDCAALLSVKESDVRNYVFKARSALREEVHRQVRESVNRETEVGEELAYLLRLFEL